MFYIKSSLSCLVIILTLYLTAFHTVEKTEHDHEHDNETCHICSFMQSMDNNVHGVVITIPESNEEPIVEIYSYLKENILRTLSRAPPV